jgi:hypothetical protein
VGPDGALIDLPGGGTLEIPAGALDTPVEIEPSEIDGPGGEAFTVVGAFHEFSPDGLEFKIEAWISVPYSLDDVEGDASTLAMAWRGPDGKWQILSGSQVNTDEKSVRSPISSLSAAGPVWLPPSASSCCVEKTDSGYTGSVLPKGQCTGAGAVEFEDLAACDEVCCAWEADGSAKSGVIPAGICTNNKGDAGPKEQCGSVCCLSAAGASRSAAVVLSGQCSETPGAEARDLADCNAACCRVDAAKDVPVLLLAPVAVCAAMGGKAEALDACDPVCCVVAKAGSAQAVSTLRGLCAGDSATVADPAACSDVCCALPQEEGPAIASKMQAAVCELAAGGTVADPSLCLPTCCVMTDGTEPPASVVPQSECDAAGGISAGDAAECAQKCCRLNDPVPGLGEYVLVPKTLCDKEGGSVSAEAQCDRICCSDKDGGSAPASAGDCTGSGGTAAALDQCTSACCSLSSPEAAALGIASETLSEEACAAVGTEADAAQCKGVCCLLAAGQTALLPQQGCAAAGGTSLGDEAACQPVCCAPTDSGPMAGQTGELPQGLCALWGSQQDGAACEQVCCASQSVAFPAAAGQCAALGGKSDADTAGCDEVCCTLAAAPDVEVAMATAATLCAAAGGASEAADCPTQCCILGASGGARRVSVAECAFFGATLASDDSQCNLVCCQKDGNSATATFYDCTATGGTPAALDSCI